MNMYGHSYTQTVKERWIRSVGSEFSNLMSWSLLVNQGLIEVTV